MSMISVQLDLFLPNDELSLLRRELELTQQRLENVQRGLFKRHGDMTKEFFEIKERIRILECKK